MFVRCGVRAEVLKPRWGDREEEPAALVHGGGCAMEVGASYVDGRLLGIDRRPDEGDDPVGDVVDAAGECVDLDVRGATLGDGDAELSTYTPFAGVAIRIGFTLEDGHNVANGDSVLTVFPHNGSLA